MKGNDLESCVRAATESNLEPRNRLSELQTMIDNLRRDVEEVLAENQRLLREAEAALEERAAHLGTNRLFEADQEARVEHGDQKQGDLQGLTTEVDQLRSVNERLVSLLAALVGELKPGEGPE